MRDKIMFAYHAQTEAMDLAIWKYLGGDTWVCTATSEKLRWMKQMRSHQAKPLLEQRGYSWKWRDAEQARKALKELSSRL